MGNRSQYFILLILRSEEATERSSSRTIDEIQKMLEENGYQPSKATLFRNIKKLFEGGYVGKGIKVANADTYYITEIGMEEIKND